MKKVSLTERFDYIFDNMLSNGPLGLISWLAGLSAAVILIVALFVQIFHTDPQMPFPAVLWTMLLQALAPNPVDVNAGPVGFLAAMLVIALVLGTRVFHALEKRVRSRDTLGQF